MEHSQSVTTKSEIVPELGLFLKEEICSQWEQILFFKSSLQRDGRQMCIYQSYFPWR